MKLQSRWFLCLDHFLVQFTWASTMLILRVYVTLGHLSSSVESADLVL
jgi:hypothetical protein